MELLVGHNTSLILHASDGRQMFLDFRDGRYILTPKVACVRLFYDGWLHIGLFACAGMPSFSLLPSVVRDSFCNIVSSVPRRTRDLATLALRRFKEMSAEKVR